MTGTFNIHAEILKYSKPLHYKYTVFSPKAEKEDDCYEFLHGYSGYTNRCLRISSEKHSQLVHYEGLLLIFYIQCRCIYYYLPLSLMFSIVDTFHQYDTIAYPRHAKAKKDFSERVREEVAEKGYVMGTLHAIKGVFTGGKQTSSRADDKEDAFIPLSIDDMCSTCLDLYLEEYHSPLSKCIFPEQFSIPAVVRKIHYMYSSLHYPLAAHTVILDRRQRNIPQVCEQAFQILKK